MATEFLQNGVSTDSSDNVKISTVNAGVATERLRIVKSSGNVLLGSTVDSTYRLKIYKDTLPVIQLANLASGETSSDGLLLYINGSNAILSNEEAGSLALQTSGTARATITSGGNVLISTTTNQGIFTNYGAMLQVGEAVTAGSSYPTLMVGGANITTATPSILINHRGVRMMAIGQRGDDANGGLVFGIAGATTQTFSNRFMDIAGSGNVLIGGTDDSLNQKLRVFGNAGNTTGVWVNNSDERIKQNIRPITGALKKVESLAEAMFHYEFIEEMELPGLRTGYIAQRLEEKGFDGHIIEGNPPNKAVGALMGWEYDEDGNITKEGDKVKSVENNFTPYLFPAMKELLEYTRKLEEKVNALEARLTVLES